VVGGQLDGPCAEGGRESPLLAARDEAIACRDQCACGDVDASGPRSGIEPAEGPPGLGDRGRVAAVDLPFEPRQVRLEVMTRGDDARQPAAHERRIPTRPQHRTQHRQQTPPPPFEPARQPLQRGGLHHDPRDEIGMAMGDRERDRAAHRVPDKDRLLDAELPRDRDVVVGDLVEVERVQGAGPAAMAAVVDPDERHPLGERPVGREELQVGRCGPSVQQHDGRRVRITMDVAADEELPPSLDPHDLGGRHPRQFERGGHAATSWPG